MVEFKWKFSSIKKYENDVDCSKQHLGWLTIKAYRETNMVDSLTNEGLDQSIKFKIHS